MDTPLVTVICLCYNQERFVREAIESVLNQTYANIELIVVDDASTDSSVEAIRDIIEKNSAIQVLSLEKNVGNCKAFNKAYALCKGEYIIDFAADDVLLPERIAKGIEALTSKGKPYGVNFSDAEWISESGTHLYNHSDRFPHHTIPEGDIYKDVIERFFICSPTVMFSRAVMAYLEGYDESLSYEDFDFWVRSSRKFCYCYTPEIMVKKRVVRKSMSEKQFALFSPQLNTTYKVMEKILMLNRNKAEQQALSKRIIYEFKLCLRLLRLSLALKYIALWLRNQQPEYK